MDSGADSGVGKRYFGRFGSPFPSARKVFRAMAKFREAKWIPVRIQELGSVSSHGLGDLSLPRGSEKGFCATAKFKQEK